MVKAPHDQFFVYEHRFSNGTIYVGKGKKSRPYMLAAGRTKSVHWLRLFNKYGAPKIDIRAGPVPEELALLAEKELIAKYRTIKVPLANLTDGGEGVSGIRFTEEQRRDNSRRRVEYLNKNPDAMTKMVNTLVAYNKQPHVGAENYERLKQYAYTPEAKQRQKMAMQREDVRSKMSEAARAAWAAPETRERLLAGTRGRDTTKLSASMYRLFSDKNNHPRTDHRIFIFIHKDGRKFVGKRIDLCTTYGVNASQLAAVVSGRFKSTLGWSIESIANDS